MSGGKEIGKGKIGNLRQVGVSLLQTGQEILSGK